MRTRLGRLPVDAVRFEEALDRVEALVAAGRGGTVFTPNVDHVVQAEDDPALRAAYADVSLSLPDGMPVLWASRLLGTGVREKVSGSDLLAPLLARAARGGWRVYVVGGAAGAAERFAAGAPRDWPGLVMAGAEGPRIDMSAPAPTRRALVERLVAARPDLVLAALGNPKQELWIAETRPAVPTAVFVAVGASIDFLTGLTRRAPRWMSRAGLEWAYRLFQEPRRLWRRYLLRDPRFVAVVARQWAEGGDGFLAKAARAWGRDRALPARERLRTLATYAAGRLTAPARLRRCDEVGAGVRTYGRPTVENHGTIRIGAGTVLSSRFAPVELRAAPGALLAIGEGSLVNFGARLLAEERVTLGRRVSLGPHVTIADHDLGAPGGPDADPEVAPVVIGDDVWLAARVTVAKGSVVGEGAVITAGSLVRGVIPPRVVAGGRPARVLRVLAPEGEATASAAVAAAVPAPPVPAPPPVELRGLLVADFHVQPLADALRAGDELGPVVDVRAAPFAQVVPTLEHVAASGEAREDFLVVWTRPESQPAFAEALEGAPLALDPLLEQVDAFAGLLARAASAARHVFVPTWVCPPGHRGLGMRDASPGGLAHAVLRMNLRLADRLSAAANVHLLDASRWLVAGGHGVADGRLWALGKIPFRPAVFAEAAADVRAALRGALGRARKVVVVDLDDTLWGGIVGDVGWENLRLGGHDAVGEAHVAFQRGLKALARRGVLLAIASKNDEAVALEALRRHPEMVLRVEDFAAWRISWNDKARGVAEIARELNLGPGALVFLDDNPRERARVREALPEVYVPEWPSDPRLYPAALQALRCFDAPVLTAEDGRRTELYAEERRRTQLLEGVSSVDEWLQGLGTRVRLEPLGPANAVRAAQLLNKTNQMNLRTRRLSQAELARWAAEPGHEVWVAHVADRVGEAGLTGIFSLERTGAEAVLADYLLSCRVMGREVEEALLWAAVERARGGGAERLVAACARTAKNGPCLEFFRRSGLEAADEDLFTWDLARAYPPPRHAKVEVLEVEERAEVRVG